MFQDPNLWVGQKHIEEEYLFHRNKKTVRSREEQTDNGQVNDVGQAPEEREAPLLPPQGSYKEKLLNMFGEEVSTWGLLPGSPNDVLAIRETAEGMKSH